LILHCAREIIWSKWLSSTEDHHRVLTGELEQPPPNFTCSHGRPANTWLIWKTYKLYNALYFRRPLKIYHVLSGAWEL